MQVKYVLALIQFLETIINVIGVDYGFWWWSHDGIWLGVSLFVHYFGFFWVGWREMEFRACFGLKIRFTLKAE
jgi:hypothetical protein